MCLLLHPARLFKTNPVLGHGALSHQRCLSDLDELQQQINESLCVVTKALLYYHFQQLYHSRGLVSRLVSRRDAFTVKKLVGIHCHRIQPERHTLSQVWLRQRAFGLSAPCTFFGLKTARTPTSLLDCFHYLPAGVRYHWVPPRLSLMSSRNTTEVRQRKAVGFCHTYVESGTCFRPRISLHSCAFNRLLSKTVGGLGESCLGEMKRKGGEGEEIGRGCIFQFKLQPQAAGKDGGLTI